MTPAARVLIAELEAHLAVAPPDWRRAALRQILELFLCRADDYSDEQVTVFDDVMCTLIEMKDRSTLVELSNRLSPLNKAPEKVICNLARHADVAIHGPVLTQARSLPDKELAAIVDKDRVDPKLLSRVAARPRLGAEVTDVLLKRGGRSLYRAVIQHPNSQISDEGYARLIMSLNGDKTLAALIAARKDVPTDMRLWLNQTLNG